MKSRFLPNQKEDSVVNYYLLPLTGNSKRDFGDNFVSAKVNSLGTTIFVLIDLDIYKDSVYDKVYLDESTYLVFNIKKEFLTDAHLILEGMYSSISDDAKDVIAKTSGLLFEKIVNGVLYSSKMILAMYKAKKLVEYMFKNLKSGDKQRDKELLSVLNSTVLMEKLNEDDFIR